MLSSELQATLKQQAYPVYYPPGRRDDAFTARAVARALWPFIYAASTRHGQDEMRRVCAQLARMTPDGWSSVVDPLEVSLATTAATFLPTSSPVAVRAALAFWASEPEPAVWQQVIDPKLG